jgi:RNA polymerase sigma-70 factor (ECF subfamily)
MPERESDATLVAAVVRADTEAFATLYVRHASTVMAVAYRLTGSVADAEDITHDVFLGLPEALARYEERGTFEAWIRKLGVRASLSHIRKRKRRHEVAFVHSEHVAPESPGQDSSITASAIRDALDHLPRKLRAVFMLKEIEGYSHREIGKLLGISGATSAVRLHRAMHHLRRTLGETR